MTQQQPYPPVIKGVLEHNRAFVARGDWRDHAAPGRPAKQLAVVTCMDTRLTHLLPDALELQNGELTAVTPAAGPALEH